MRYAWYPEEVSQQNTEETTGMNDKDYMIRAVAADEQVRAFAVTSRSLVEEARKAHGTSQVATAALGRTLSGALMMTSLLKNPDDLITLQYDCDGPIGGITVTANNRGDVKGYVKNGDVVLPPKDNGHLDVGRAVGKGTLTVIRDLDLKNTYNGQVAIYNGEIAEDLTHYYAESEQVPTTIGLGVLTDHTDGHVKEAGGFLVQLMPFATDEVISRIEENMKHIQDVTVMLSEGMTPEDMLRKVLDGLDVTVTETIPVQFHCNCSRERVENALMLVGTEELDDMIREGKDVTLNCQFCGKAYTFGVEDLKQIRERAAKSKA